MRHLTGVPHILGLLTTVFLAETGSPPPAKQWNRSFSANSETQWPHCLRYRPPERACSPSVSPWPNCWSPEPDLCTSAMTGVGPGLAQVAADRLEGELGLAVRGWLH